jgi:hypothetical protein|nr:MAG TPA: Ras family [Caudoviricetes sp.]
MIYRVVNTSNDKDKPVYGLSVYLTDKFALPKKIYGNILEKVQYIWNVFAAPNGRASVLCTGSAGAGKSLLAKLLINAAVETHDISPEPIEAIVVTEIEGCPELIAYLSGLDKCVIMIDEFGKLFSNYDQQMMLTLLSDHNKRRMFVLTENDSGYIQRFILNRPERVRYHFEFDRLENSVISEFCKDHNVPTEFMKDLLKLNMVNSKFNFDQLATLVEEATRSNRWDLAWLVEMLNLKVLKAKEQYKPISVSRIDDDSVSLVLEPMLISEGINIIKVTDRDLDIPMGPNPMPMSMNPTPDAMADIFNSGMPNPIVNQPNRPEGNSNPSKLKLKEEIDEAYLDVDLSTNDSDYEYRAQKQQQERMGNTYVKLNLTPDSLIDINDKEHSYRDVTGKFKIKIEYGKKSF